jgi:hypothetical protein
MMTLFFRNGLRCKYFKVQLFTVSQFSTVIPLENLFENKVWTAEEFQATLGYHDLVFCEEKWL